MNPFSDSKRLAESVRHELRRQREAIELMRAALGRIESRQCAASDSTQLDAHEFQVWSQWGEDGILDFLLRHVPVARRVFVEFGVETYIEANTRFLLTQRGWSGLVLDGSEENIRAIRRDPIYWRHNLKAVHAFVTRESIMPLLREHGIAGEIGLLSIDIDGNDYWVWEAIGSEVNPALVVIEYNARFGPERAVTVPYDSAFARARAHPSCIYYGASLAALVALGRRKGYACVGSNTAANNAFFVRRDLLPPAWRELTAAEAWRPWHFRESRDAQGALTFASAEEERALLSTLPVEEVGR
jgi:hypothetical protein